MIHRTGATPQSGIRRNRGRDVILRALDRDLEIRTLREFSRDGRRVCATRSMRVFGIDARGRKLDKSGFGEEHVNG